MHSIEEIKIVVEIFKSNCSFELMHCVSTYPTDIEDSNLKMIETLRMNSNVILDSVHTKVGEP